MKTFKNRLEEMAEATVNALNYSNSSVEFPNIDSVQKWPDEIVLPLYALYKNASYSELSSIIQYTQHQARFPGIGELMLGIGLVEMIHYDKLGDFLLKASDFITTTSISINPNIDLGKDMDQAIQLALESEIQTLEAYKEVLKLLDSYIDREDYSVVYDFICKFIADEEFHIELLKSRLPQSGEPETVTQKKKTIILL